MKADNAHTLELFFFFFLNEVEYLNVFPVIAANAGEGLHYGILSSAVAKETPSVDIQKLYCLPG